MARNGGTIVNAAVHNANIDYVVKATASRTPAQELPAYLDDRRGKGYSVTDGMGPLTDAWRSAARQTTTITDIAGGRDKQVYDDGGNNNGVGGSANAEFGKVIDLVNAMGNNGSTEPAKRFYKYARPYRWSSAVQVMPAADTGREHHARHRWRLHQRPLGRSGARRARAWPTRCRSATRKWSAAASSWAKAASWPACIRRST